MPGKVVVREVILLCLPGSLSCLVAREVCKHGLLVAASKIAVVCVAGMSKQIEMPLALRFPLQSLWPINHEAVCLFQWADGCRCWINFVSHIGDLRPGV